MNLQISGEKVFNILSVIKEWFRLNYSQTCIKRSPLGQRKVGLIKQVTAWAGLAVFD
jgi:hypothetical protein